MAEAADTISAFDAFQRGASGFIGQYEELFSEELDADGGGFPEYPGQLFFYGDSFDVQRLEKDARTLVPLYTAAVQETTQTPGAFNSLLTLAGTMNEFLGAVSAEFRIV